MIWNGRMLAPLWLSALSAAAELTVSAPRALLVCDATPSMYGAVADSKKSKLDAAKSMVLRMMEQWPAHVQVGLMTYGHGGKGAAEIQLLEAIGAPSLDAVRRKISALQPKSTPPLGSVLMAAAAAFGPGDEAGTVVLITDGMEAGEGGVIEKLREIRRTKPGLRVHVVSFPGSEQNPAALRAVAETSQGEFFNIASQAELEEDFERIIEYAVDGANLVVEVEGDKARRFDWRIYPGEPNGAGQRPLLATLHGPGLAFRATPGLYWITAKEGEDVHSLRLFVPEDRSLRLECRLAKGQMSFPGEGAGRQVGYSIRLDAPDAPPAISSVSQGGAHVVELPSGHYRARVTSLAKPAEDVAFTIEPGEAREFIR